MTTPTGYSSGNQAETAKTPERAIKPYRTGAWVRSGYAGEWFYTANPERYADNGDLDFFETPEQIELGEASGHYGRRI